MGQSDASDFSCYGTVDIQCSSDLAVQKIVVTKKHDAPRYIYASGEQLIVKAPVINHTDDELFMLEAAGGGYQAFTSRGRIRGKFLCVSITAVF